LPCKRDGMQARLETGLSCPRGPPPDVCMYVSIPHSRVNTKHSTEGCQPGKWFQVILSLLQTIHEHPDTALTCCSHKLYPTYSATLPYSTVPEGRFAALNQALRKFLNPPTHATSHLPPPPLPLSRFSLSPTGIKPCSSPHALTCSISHQHHVILPRHQPQPQIRHTPQQRPDGRQVVCQQRQLVLHASS